MSRDDAEQFLRACGGDQPIRFSVGLTGDAAWESWVFNQPCLLIGRRADSDLVLDHWQISRRHAYVQYLDGGFICVDLGSRTGTYGGPANERAGWIPRNHAVRIGPYEVRPTWPDRRPDREHGNQIGVTWELPRKAAGGAMWRMDRPLVLVGHSPACRVRIVAGDVSNFHCSLVRTQYGVWAVDLLGTGGMQVNGVPARIARLDEGDELQIGRHILRPRYDEPPARLGPVPPGMELILIEPSGLQPLGPDDPFPPRPDHDGVDHLPARLDPFAGKSNLVRPRVAPPVLAPFAINVPAIEGPAGTAFEPVVTSLVQQFGAMQQQMFDQFHQTMMAMFEGFAAMHREQSDAMRAEMDEVRRLSKEIADLQAETERIAEAARAREAEAAEAAKQAARNPAFRPPPPRTAPGLPPGTAPGAAGTTIPSAFTAPTGPPVPPPAGGDDDIHALLVRKLAAMHNERQGRWQKILGMMGSKP